MLFISKIVGLYFIIRIAEEKSGGKCAQRISLALNPVSNANRGIIKRERHTLKKVLLFQINWLELNLIMFFFCLHENCYHSKKVTN